jgi:hypothetical protein
MDPADLTSARAGFAEELRRKKRVPALATRALLESPSSDKSIPHFLKAYAKETPAVSSIPAGTCM